MHLFVCLNILFDIVLTILSCKLVNRTSTYDAIFPFMLCFAVGSGFLLSADLSVFVTEWMELVPSTRVLAFKVIVMTGLIISFFRSDKPVLNPKSVASVISELERNQFDIEVE